MIKIIYLLVMFPVAELPIGNPTSTGHVIETYQSELQCLKRRALLDMASKDNTYECHAFKFNIPKGTK